MTNLVVRQSISETIKKRWQDPDYRARQEASRAQAAVRRSATMKAKYQDPEFRSKLLTARSAPEVRAKMSASRSLLMKEWWQDPEYREQQSKRLSELAKTRQGHRAPGWKDGRSRGVEYRAYWAAQQRCTNPKNPRYPSYGGRGIKFKFTSFEQFMEEVGPRPSAKHSLDRIDNEKGYEPGNVGWRTDGEQIANRRRFGCLEVYSNAELAAELERRGMEVLKKNATDDAVYADA
jgi:hypothetical protein